MPEPPPLRRFTLSGPVLRSPAPGQALRAEPEENSPRETPRSQHSHNLGPALELGGHRGLVPAPAKQFSHATAPPAPPRQTGKEARPPPQWFFPHESRYLERLLPPANHFRQPVVTESRRVSFVLSDRTTHCNPSTSDSAVSNPTGLRTHSHIRQSAGALTWPG